MGYLDREYYREDDEPGLIEWVRRRVAVCLVIVTGMVFFVQLFSSNHDRVTPDPILQYGGLDAEAVEKGQIWRVFTSSFIHNTEGLSKVAPAGWLYMLINMYFLYSFGSKLEEVVGGREILAFYLLAAIFWGICTFALKMGGVLNRETISCGSGAAVFGLLAWVAVRDPKAPVMFFFFPMPMWGAVATLIGINFFFVLNTFHWKEIMAADLLGVAFAIIYHRLGFRVGDWMAYQVSGRRSSKRTRLRVVPRDEQYPDNDTDDQDAEPVAATASPRHAESKQALDEQLEAKLDMVLEKVSKQGRDSLTADEKAILLRASEIYKKRRGR